MCQAQCKVLEIQEEKKEEEYNFVFHYFKTLESRQKKMQMKRSKIACNRHSLEWRESCAWSSHCLPDCRRVSPGLRPHHWSGRWRENGQQEQWQRSRPEVLNCRHLKEETQRLSVWLGKATQAVLMHSAHPGSNVSFISNRLKPLVTGKCISLCLTP